MKLLAFSGKKQSGKDASAKFLMANARVLFGERRTRDRDSGPRENILPVRTKTYWFGKPMKDFAESLGVERRKLWGTNAEKNELVDITWESLPHYLKLLRKMKLEVMHEAFVVRTLKPTGDQTIGDVIILESDRRKRERFFGKLTARQLLQQIGEEMFLDMDPKHWVRTFEQQIKADYNKVDIGFVADPRKPEQIDSLHRLGGKVIRFLRDPYEGTDRHISEVALDPPGWDQKNFDAVIDNREMTVVQTRMQIVGTLLKWGWVKLEPLDIEWALSEERGL